ncbi:hypothetical protein H671_6g16925 [Cricetulus griseus]|nr:hypothetical protein H671_6g16925 [Cricetulus griseus]
MVTAHSVSAANPQKNFLPGTPNGYTGIQFVYMVDYIDGFPYVEPSLHPWDEAYLIMVDDFFLICSWIRFTNILLSILAWMFMKDIGL